MRIKINENFYQVDEKDLEKFKLEPTNRETLLTKIGKQIYEKRKRKGLTLKDVAKNTGLSVSLLSQIENGVISPSIMTLSLVGGYLGINIVIRCK